MSTASSNNLPLTSNRLTAESAGQHLQDHLRKTAKLLKILDILILAFTGAGFLLGIWLLGSIIDHWLVPIPQSLRWGIWILSAGTLSWATIHHLVPLLVHRINPAYAAIHIEKMSPEFKNGLISWLEFQSRPDLAIPKGIMAAIGYRAYRFIGFDDPTSTVDTNPLIKRVGLAFALMLALAVYAILSPKSLMESGKRLLMPWRNIPAPTRVQILAVTPGHVELTQSRPLDVQVDLRGLSARDSVFLRYNSLDGQLVNQRVTLEATVERLKYNGQIRTGRDGIDHEILYWIEAGDAASGPFEVRLNPLPSMALRTVQVDFPQYTRRDSIEFPASTPIEALEGSVMRITGSSNQPLKRAKLIMNPQLNQQGSIVQGTEFLDLNHDQTEVSGAVKLSLQQKTFCLMGENLAGDANIHPVIMPMTVYADVPPEITLVGPEDRTVKVGPASKLTLEIRASDADFGLSKIQLEIRAGAQAPSTKILLDDAHLQKQPVLTKVLSHPIDLASMNTRVGDRLRIIATAFDNRHDPVTGEFKPNQRQSLPLILEVVAPADSRIPPELDPSSNRDATSPDPTAPQPDQSPQKPDNSSTRDEPSKSKQNGAGQSPAGGTSSSSSDEQSDDPSGSGSSSQERNSGENRQQSQTGPGDTGRQDNRQQSQQTDKQASEGNAEAKPQAEDDQSKSEPGQSGSGQPAPSAANRGSPDPSTDDPRTSDESPQDQGASDQKARDEETLQKIRDFMNRSDRRDQTNQRSSNDKTERGDSAGDSAGEPRSDQQQPMDNQSGQSSDKPKNQSDNQQSSSPDSSNQDGTDRDGTDQASDKQDGQMPDRSGSPQNQAEEALQQPTGNDPSESNQPKDHSGQKDSQAPPTDSPPSPSASDKQSSDKQSSDKQSGDKQSGDNQSGDNQSGDKQSGDPQSGDQSPGDKQADKEQSSDQQSPDQQSPDQQSSDQQSSDQRSADKSAGDKRPSDQSSGSKESDAARDEAAGGQDGQPGSSGADSQPIPPSSPEASHRDGNEAASAAPGSGSNGGSNSRAGMGSTEAGTGTASDPSLAEQATDLTLDYLERQREQPDPELLKELNWTSEDLSKFLDRYQSARNLSAQAQAQETDAPEMHRLRTGTQQSSAIGPSGQADEFRQQLDSGGRGRPPERLRRQIEQFQKALQQGN